VRQRSTIQGSSVSFLFVAGRSFTGRFTGRWDDVQLQSCVLVRAATPAEPTAFTLDLLIILQSVDPKRRSVTVTGPTGVW